MREVVQRTRGQTGADRLRDLYRTWGASLRRVGTSQTARLVRWGQVTRFDGTVERARALRRVMRWRFDPRAREVLFEAADWTGPLDLTVARAREARRVWRKHGLEAAPSVWCQHHGDQAHADYASGLAAGESARPLDLATLANLKK